jgi:hypothetical protein
MTSSHLRRGKDTRSAKKRLARAKRSRVIEDAKFRVRQAQGKLRRFVQSNFRKEDVAEALSLRRGECNRCGACCEILFKCPFLKKHWDNTTSCGIYEDRPNQCRLFPLNKKDLEEVHGSCSFYFIERSNIENEELRMRPDQQGGHIPLGLNLSKNL